jgi:XRE family transcriptional regulator, aerobic/anaerobic benzoate catabolism transcriptional regulator
LHVPVSSIGSARAFSPDLPMDVRNDEGASPNAAAPPTAALDDGAYLQRLGQRVRDARTRRGMTRKILAHDSGVSERYLALLETGQGNISIVLLRQVARALNMRLEDLVREEADPSVDARLLAEFLGRLSADELSEVRTLLTERFGGFALSGRHRRIALVGLRGAGKSTLGRRLAERLSVPFLELDAEVERASGVSLGEIFALYGQTAYRRWERRCLDEIVERHPRGFVLATGGSIVAEAATFERLLAHCYTVWLRASPEEHMSRVVAQGDLRPMANNKEAMEDLRRILAVRNPLYAKADAVVDTSGQPVDAALQALLAAVHH